MVGGRWTICSIGGAAWMAAILLTTCSMIPTTTLAFVPTHVTTSFARASIASTNQQRLASDNYHHTSSIQLNAFFGGGGGKGKGGPSPTKKPTTTTTTTKSNDKSALRPIITDKRRKQLGIPDGDDEYDLGMALRNNTDDTISKIIAGSLIVAILALLVAGIVIPATTDFGEGVCQPLLTGGRC
jgi:hypothetical protein